MAMKENSESPAILAALLADLAQGGLFQEAVTFWPLRLAFIQLIFMSNLRPLSPSGRSFGRSLDT